MFGFIIPDKSNIQKKDFEDYKSFYCGFCKTYSEYANQLMRLGTTYDITFFNLFIHGLFGEIPNFANESCILNPVQTKRVAKTDRLTLKVMDFNNILLHYKLKDNIIDDNSKKARLANFVVLKRHYNKSKEREPEIDKIVSDSYERLREYEKDNSGMYNVVSDVFGNMLAKCSNVMFDYYANKDTYFLMYNIGKWIYLMDAVADVMSDKKTNSYNPFLVTLKFDTFDEFVNNNKDLLQTLLYDCYRNIRHNYDNIQLKAYEGVITNILWYGILSATNTLLGSKEGWKRIRI